MSATVRLDPAEILAYGSKPTYDLSESLARRSQASMPPLSLPRSQVYYWGYAWQSDEAESLAAIEDGRGVRFSSGADLANWLLNDDDDDPS